MRLCKGRLGKAAGPLRIWPALQEETVTAAVWVAGSCPGDQGRPCWLPVAPSLSSSSRHLPLILGHGAWGCWGARGHQAERKDPGPFTLRRQGASTQLSTLRACEGPAAAIVAEREGCVCPPRGRPVGPGSPLPPGLSLSLSPASLSGRRVCLCLGGCRLLEPCSAPWSAHLEAGFLGSDVTPHPGVSALLQTLFPVGAGAIRRQEHEMLELVLSVGAEQGAPRGRAARPPPL